MQFRPYYLICLLLIVFITPVKSQELYVGANYHPQDSNLQQWQKDISLMKDAGFKVVRMGHLAWDSYEPGDGKFNFAWFDTVMNMMDKAGIKVILDIAIRPAPLWLHHKYPSVNITGASGNMLYPNSRYMVDIGDTDYQRYAFKYADTLTKRYANYPALLAFGIDNESGDGYYSYSETAKQRFIAWLKKKYTSVDSLNKAWAGQRWSRRISDFDEVGFPASGNISGPPERVLDFRRFESDEISNFLFKLLAIVHTNAPKALTTTNAWYYSYKKYFDYSKIAYSGKMDRDGGGFYPGNSLVDNNGLDNACFGIERVQFESPAPYWGVEFTTMTAVPNSIRKTAYASLMYGNQMVCGWTWQSMAGGEEQYLEGMVDWDGYPNRKYQEYKQIAAEFKKIEKYGFPYKVKADVALAFSYDSQITSYSFPEQHDEQLQTCFNLFSARNIDTRMVEINKSELKYKLLLLPGYTVMDQQTADKIREYVKNGGTVIMTGYSDIVDIHGQVFTSIHPGLLNDLFGIRIASFEETANLNEISRAGFVGNKLKINYNNTDLITQSPRFDIIEPKGAAVLGKITSLDKDYPIITSNKYGKGTAIYIGIPARQALLDPLLDQLLKNIVVNKGPEVPKGVMARYINNNHILYLNLDKEDKVITLKGAAKSILTGNVYTGHFILKPFEPEFIEMNK
jgi:beta-galactosidase